MVLLLSPQRIMPHSPSAASRAFVYQCLLFRERLWVYLDTRRAPTSVGWNHRSTQKSAARNPRGMPTRPGMQVKSRFPLGRRNDAPIRRGTDPTASECLCARPAAVFPPEQACALMSAITQAVEPVDVQMVHMDEWEKFCVAMSPAPSTRTRTSPEPNRDRKSVV